MQAQGYVCRWVCRGGRGGLGIGGGGSVQAQGYVCRWLGRGRRTCGRAGASDLAGIKWSGGNCHLAPDSNSLFRTPHKSSHRYQVVWGETPGSWPTGWMVSEPLVVGAAPTQADATGLNFQVRVQGFV